MIFGLVFSSPFVCQYDLKRFAIKENGNPDKRQFRDGRKEKKERKNTEYSECVLRRNGRDNPTIFIIKHDDEQHSIFVCGKHMHISHMHS